MDHDRSPTTECRVIRDHYLFQHSALLRLASSTVLAPAWLSTNVPHGSPAAGLPAMGVARSSNWLGDAALTSMVIAYRWFAPGSRGVNCTGRLASVIALPALSRA